MRSNRVTIYDVAQRAGVATATVSRVLNDSPKVAAATRERVLNVIEELEYRPRRIAKSLAQQTYQTLAVATPTFTTPFHNEFLKGVRDRLAGEDIDILLCDLGSTAPEERLRRFLSRGTVDALLLTGVPVDPELAADLRTLKAPVVLIGHHHSDFDCFYWDDREASRRAVEHFIERGHDRIGMIRTHTDSFLQRQRVDGYRSALEAAGLSFDPELVASGSTTKHAGFSEEHGYEAMQVLLKLKARPTAVFASSDTQALGAMKAIREAGLSVPEDVALIGFDNVKTSTYVGLSSVDQHISEVGFEATALLLERVGGARPDAPVARPVTPELRVRSSSGRPRF